MRYVHVECLNSWRALSTNSNSYYRCDQCHYEYNLQRTDWAEAVQQPETVQALTAMMCLLLIIFAAIPAYLLGIHSQFYEWVEWSPPWHAHHHQSSKPWLSSLAGLLDFLASGTVVVAFTALGQDHREMKPLRRAPEMPTQKTFKQ